MKKSVFLGVFVAGVVLFGSCGGNKQQQYVEEEDDNSASVEDKEVRDRTIYGICTAGTGMNTLQMITDSGDTLKLNISRANEMGKVFGGLQPSDRLAVVPDSSGRMALQVINLNTLMGDWVMPDPIDGSAEVGIRIKEGGIAESIDQSVIVYRTWKIINSAGHATRRRPSSITVGRRNRKLTFTDSNWRTLATNSIRSKPVCWWNRSRYIS